MSLVGDDDEAVAARQDLIINVLTSTTCFFSFVLALNCCWHLSKSLRNNQITQSLESALQEHQFRFSAFRVENVPGVRQYGHSS